MTDAATQAAAEALAAYRGGPASMHRYVAAHAVAAARPIIEAECQANFDLALRQTVTYRAIEAEVRDAIRRRYETNTCDCGHDRSAHHSGDLGDCSDCPYGTCVAPYDKGLMWDRRHGLRDEAELRERIAAEIEAYSDTQTREVFFDGGDDVGGWYEYRDALSEAARIARGGTS